MAAKSVIVCFYTAGGSSDPDLQIEPRWWDPQALCADPRFEKTNETGSYFDWSADLTEEDFRTLHETFRPHATTGIYADAASQLVIQPQLQAMDGALAGAIGELTKVRVTVFEWESGLG